ncbi:MAG TPA: LLM class F420-dependent oxidoreductase [Reyranella sp.]|jgi:probable F420-dependent oxidoreductase|nr:LLM class F420-dependent oxidoreductase [Reyranella sp.]
MQFGFSAPTAGPLSSLDNLTRLCTGAEELGFAYGTFSDHVVIPTDIASPYPYSASGEFTNQGTGERNEQLIELAFVAARTSKLRLVTSVMVVPHRPAVLAAKQLATIDTLSGGRVTLGIGAGWMKEEFEALGVPAFEERGKVTDEYIAAFKELWTKERPRFSGKYVKFDKITFAPKPAQKGGIPIWVGGESGPALRRTAKYGDAWYPIPNNPAFPMDSLKRVNAAIARLRQLSAEAGRDPKAVGITIRFPRYGAGVPDKAGDGERRLFSGSSKDIARDIRDLAALGVGAIDSGFDGATVPEILISMKRFNDEVRGKV